jgi:hypothetical protein
MNKKSIYDGNQHRLPSFFWKNIFGGAKLMRGLQKIPSWHNGVTAKNINLIKFESRI